jgi:hypothetical protein
LFKNNWNLFEDIKCNQTAALSNRQKRREGERRLKYKRALIDHERKRGEKKKKKFRQVPYL